MTVTGHDRMKLTAVAASTGVAALLIGVKAGAWLATDSVAMLASLMDSLLDAVASGIALWGILQSRRPADAAHRFGHGKAEGVAALAQCGIICASAVFVIAEAVHHLAEPRPISQTNVGAAVMALSIILTLALVAYQRRVISATGSVSVSADKVHYTADLLGNLAVLVTLLVIGATGWLWLDAVCGLAVAAFLLHGAWTVGNDALDLLLDRELPADDRDRITAIALGHKRVHGVHDLRTRNAGNALFVELHIELDPDMRLELVHEVSDAVVALIRRRYPSAQVTVHPDPAGLDEHRLDDQVGTPDTSDDRAA